MCIKLAQKESNPFFVSITYCESIKELFLPDSDGSRKLGNLKPSGKKEKKREKEIEKLKDTSFHVMLCVEVLYEHPILTVCPPKDTNHFLSIFTASTHIKRLTKN